MSRYWSAIVHRLHPYVPGEQPQIPDLIKLNTNENPYPPSPHVLDALKAAVDDRLRLYPDPASEALRQCIADYYQVSQAEVFVGNGSDEVLAHAFQAFFQQSEPLLFPDITYSFYPVYCGLYGIEYETVPLNEDFSLPLNRFLIPAGGVIFPNPNAPTGRALSRSEIEAFLQQKSDCVVIVDEAYVDFGAESCIPLVKNYPNLMVISTLSKSRALAGLRIGYAIAQAELIEGLVRVKDSFNSYPMDRLAQVAGIASFEDETYFQKRRQQVMQSRARLAEELELLGFHIVPSMANFIFARPPKAAESVAEGLRERGVIVRHFKQPRIQDYLRITVGTEQENQALLKALQEVLT